MRIRLFLRYLLIIVYILGVASLSKYLVVSKVVFDLNGSNITQYFQIFFNIGKGFNQNDSVLIPIVNNRGSREYISYISVNHLKELRFDPAMKPGIQYLDNFSIGNKVLSSENLLTDFDTNDEVALNSVNDSSQIEIVSSGNDPILQTRVNPKEFKVSSGFTLFTLFAVCIFVGYYLLYNKKFIKSLNQNVNHITSRFEKIFLYIIIIYFLSQACFYAGATKIWDYPDEIGHFSYIAELAKGKIPRLPTSMMDSIASKSWSPHGTSPNWIAQHPPAYYLSLVPLYLLSSYLNFPLENTVFILRLFTVVYSCTAIYFIYLTLKKIGCSPAIRLAVITSVSSIPMLSSLSGAISNDIALFAFVSVATYFLVKNYQRFSLRTVYFFSLFSTLALLTKFTAIPLLMIPTVVIGYKAIRSSKSIGRTLLAFSPYILVLLFFLYNLISYGSPIADNTNLGGEVSKNVAISFYSLLTSQPVFNNVFKSFFASYGWMSWGSGNTALALTIPLPLVGIYLFLTFSIFSFYFYLRTKHFFNRFHFVYFLIVVLLTVYLGVESLSFVKIFLSTSLLFSFLLYIKNKHKPLFINELFILLSISVSFFIFVYLLKLKSLFTFYGMLRATNGRYLFILIPFINIYLMSDAKIINKHPVLVWTTSLLFAAINIYFFRDFVLPFLSY